MLDMVFTVFNHCDLNEDKKEKGFLKKTKIMDATIGNALSALKSSKEKPQVNQ